MRFWLLALWFTLSLPSYGKAMNKIVAETISKNRQPIRACYQSELEKNPKLEGKVRFRFSIAPNGRTNLVEIKESTLKSPPVETCLIKWLKTLTFENPNKEEVVVGDFPLFFNP